MKILRVFALWRPWLGPFISSFLARLTQDGASVHLYVSRPIDVAGVRCTLPVDSTVHVAPFQRLYEVACEPVSDVSEAIRNACREEDWLGVPFARLAVADRHFGRGHALGGPMFPTSRQSRANHAQVAKAYTEQSAFWRRQVEAHRPDVIIDPDPVLSAVAAKLGMPIRMIAGGRVKNLYYWADTPYLETARLAPLWQEMVANGEAPASLEIEPATLISTYWQTAMRQATWTHFAESAARQVGRRVWHRLRGSDLGPGYDLLSTLFYLYRRRRQLRRMTRPSLMTLPLLERRRFVYFPLATEPETTLQGLSPEYFFQLETIAAIARDLPADVVLAVKEHQPACGARSDLFYDQIEAFKNVVLLDLRERGVDAIRRAAATVTIAGSAGFEAAAMGKPTIVLGRHNIYDFLPHVRRVEDVATLGAALRDALEERLAGPDAPRHGATMVKALESLSWDMGAFDPFSAASHVADEVVDSAYHLLHGSLGSPGS